MTKKNTATLANIEYRFSYWRKTRHEKGPIPEKLWQAACRLSGQYPTAYICQKLGLNHNDYKRKCTQLKDLHSNKEVHTAKFVRIDNKHLKVPTSIFPTSNCLVEIQNRNGSILKINPNNGQPVDLDSIIRSFAGGFR
jgi:hypothetical protein